jgi:hypothetical protein
VGSGSLWFFGSGKSSFAKNLGYALQNRKLIGRPFADLFKKQIDDKRVENLLDSITTRFPTEVILFEVAKERDTRKVTERIAELMYTVLLRELGYAEDFDIAELEIELEVEGKLDKFVRSASKYDTEWRIVRKVHKSSPVRAPSSMNSHLIRSRPKIRGRMPNGTMPRLLSAV